MKAKRSRWRARNASPKAGGNEAREPAGHRAEILSAALNRTFAIVDRTRGVEFGSEVRARAEHEEIVHRHGRRWERLRARGRWLKREDGLTPGGRRLECGGVIHVGCLVFVFGKTPPGPAPESGP